MSSLDTFSRAHAQAVRELGRVAPPLTDFLEDLTPFARATQPALRSLGEISTIGRNAVKASEPVVDKLNETAKKGTAELSTNLRFVLEHLNDRDAGVHKDNKATRQLASPGPGGDRYTGWEAFLQYAYDQTLAGNMYNQNGHFLTIDAIAAGPCGTYQDAKSVRDNPDLEKKCSGNVIGPSTPGIHDPDPGKRPTTAAQRAKVRRRQGDLEIRQRAISGQASKTAPAEAVLDYLLSP
jgi:hypothetical protein